MARVRANELAGESEKEERESKAARRASGTDAGSRMGNVEEAEAGKSRGSIGRGTAKIKEDEHMQQNSETDAAKKAGAEQQGAQPKKKNIIQVFRPQNSKTGMVKPGSRPRPQGQGKPRPKGAPGARPQGAAGVRPQGAAGVRPQGAPGPRPQGASGARPQSVAGARLQGTAPVRPQGAAGVRPQDAAAVGSQGAPEPRTQGEAVPARTPEAASAGTARRQSEPKTAAPEHAAPLPTGAAVKGSVSAKENTSVPGSAGAGTGRPQAEVGAQGARGAGAPGRSQGTQGTRTRSAQGGAGRSQGGRDQGGAGRSQGGRYQGGAGRSQGGRDQGGAGRSQGGRYQDGAGRSQGGRYQDGAGRSQGGRYQDGVGRGQGGRGTGTQGRGQGSRGQNGLNRGQGGRPGSIPKAPAESKPLEKESRKRTERGDRNRSNKGEKLDRMEKNVRQNNQKGGPKKGQQPKTPAPKPEETIRNIVIPEKLTVSELAEAMKVAPSALIKKLFLQGMMVTVNQELDFDKAEEIALEFNCICEKEVKVNVIEELLKEEEDDEATMAPRSPVVCVMGHVDHGKTSLLDAIRHTHVIDKEAGGITQHIGAYVVSINGQKITFLDTPGHEAFTAMRMRGANATDIAILVVAADDGVMPQTVEAISHAKAAGVEIIVAINKIDKPSANVERVKQELSEYELIPEDWGGSTVFVPVSAHTHEGIDSLLEMILLTAEVSELRANPNRRARGLVIEAELDKGKGPVATVLVQKGTLHVGDPVAAGSCYGRVRAMMDDKGRRVKEAGPSTPVEILGFSDVPNAGEIFMAMENEKEARSFAETFISEGRERLLEDTKSRMSLDDLFSQIQAGNLKELNIIVKADVQGSVEAVKQSLLKLSNEEVVVKIIHGGVGAINESDVTLASASNAIIIGFNVRPDATAKATAERENVDIRMYRVIYDAIADVEAAMKGMLDPIYEEKVIGHAEVRQLFRASGVGTIAGAYVTDGVFQRNCKARILRDDKVIYEGALASLKRFKDDVKEVRAGYECGFVFEKFNDIMEEDKVEAFVMAEVPR